MSVKPHDVAPLLRAKVQTKMRLWSRTALFTTPTLWKQELFYSKVSFRLRNSWNKHRKKKPSRERKNCSPLEYIFSMYLDTVCLGVVDCGGLALWGQPHLKKKKHKYQHQIFHSCPKISFESHHRNLLNIYVLVYNLNGDCRRDMDKVGNLFHLGFLYSTHIIPWCSLLSKQNWVTVEEKGVCWKPSNHSVRIIHKLLQRQQSHFSRQIEWLGYPMMFRIQGSLHRKATDA